MKQANSSYLEQVYCDALQLRKTDTNTSITPRDSANLACTLKGSNPARQCSCMQLVDSASFLQTSDVVYVLQTVTMKINIRY